MSEGALSPDSERRKIGDSVLKIMAEYCANQSQHSAILDLLRQPGFALSPRSHCRTGLLVLGGQKAAAGTVDARGYIAAAGSELIIAACHVFDHVADRQIDSSQAEQIALSITILTCGLAAVHDSLRASNSQFHVSEVIKAFISAAEGQFLDAHMQGAISITTEEALQIAILKGGHLGKMAGFLGASLSTQDEATIVKCSDFGCNLFTCAQLIDDARDAMAGENNSDFSQGKATIPLTYFRTFCNSQYNGTSMDKIGDGTRYSEDDLKTSASLYLQSGADTFVRLTAATYLERSRANLDELRVLDCNVSLFEHLVESLE